MATVSIETIREIDADQCVELHDVDWKGYSALLRLRGDRSTPRIVYLDGTVWLMSPAFAHEKLNERLGWIVEVLGEELDVPFIAAASTTLCRRRKRGGVEGDQTYYLANERHVRDKKKINLRTDPSPDLAIEAVHSHDADAAIEVYRRFKVPEVWVCDEAELVILVLRPNRKYARATTSAAFPFLTAPEIHERVTRPQSESDMEWFKVLRCWVKETLAPRVSVRRTSGTEGERQQTDPGHRKES
jgi:Uma2 family endonuclease